MTSSEYEMEEEPRARSRVISVEPVVFLSLAVQGVLFNIRTQYVEARLAAEYNYTLPEAGNCSLANKSADATGKEIESETSLWVMYMCWASVFFPIFTGTILIAASDIVGRKPILIINAFGHLLAATIFMLVAWLHLPLIVAVAAECIIGLGGDSAVSINVSFAYIADTSTAKSLVNKYTILSFMIYIGFGGSQILVDLILQNTGNYNLTFGCAWVFAFLYVLNVSIPGILLESVKNHTKFKVVATVKGLLKSFVRLVSVSEDKRQSRLVLLVFIKMVFFLINEAIYAVITIYGIGQPFCWSPTMVGIYNVIVNACPAFVAMVMIKPLLFCMSGYIIMQVGFLSGIAILIVSATAKTSNILVYAVVAVGSLRTIPNSLADFFLSKMVSKDEQGTALALLSITSSIGKMLSPILMNAVYAKAVLLDFPQLTFYLAAAIYLIPIILTAILQFLSHPYDRNDEQIQGKIEERKALMEDYQMDDINPI
ncbi:proton-coupled folate transporter-like isoform X2 [Lytechinus variegatus]|nr:proton-coupled folate transporter-like isoform X2 [Lytechinus variegatus]XP_041472133.1 proton-coupled folate transporter-like isoform X2 [Lytechinus variegatus]XP_041472135.1 proton-coupled folate transporter-like isoform X2 [Lytechinus variegatus]XP_041472136.1 proton-coupled folate transporter-like isoform X2 [Lytechinus variegatus]